MISASGAEASPRGSIKATFPNVIYHLKPFLPTVCVSEHALIVFSIPYELLSLLLCYIYAGWNAVPMGTGSRQVPPSGKSLP